jgi:hypothetical protein
MIRKFIFNQNVLTTDNKKQTLEEFDLNKRIFVLVGAS